MRDIYRITLLGGFLLLVVGGYVGCDRLKGTLNENQRPIVEFVNVPIDSSGFNYAPIIYWFGYDPDGLVEFYSWYDDTTQQAVEAYRNDDLVNYVASVPEDAWIDTVATQATIYLLTQAGDTTQHIFFIRCTDNDGAVSDVKARSFFRSNEAPNRPKVSVLPVEDFFEAIDMIEDTACIDTVVTYHVGYQDTLLMGATLTQTYGGMQILWTGNDPDDRELITIPLQFSYLLVKERDSTVIHFPGDTIQQDGWTQWSASKTKTLYGLETGTYVFYLKSRDDGLTECGEPAWVRFHCIQPTFEYKLLVVDENGPSSGLGAVHPDSIMAFHMENLAEAWGVMPLVYPDCTWTSDDYRVWENRGTLTSRKAIPYSLIHQFQLVWIIDDERGGLSVVADRVKVMEDYLDVGGMIMITGRKIFCGTYNICSQEVQTFSASETEPQERFFVLYFNVSEGLGTVWPASPIVDFNGATGALFDYPDLEIDSAKVKPLFPRHYDYLPEVDWVGRNRETTTIYYYKSSSADETYEVYDHDCRVTLSTPYYCKLQPVDYDRLLSVSRIYNRTRDVYGEFMYFTDDNSAFMVSTPAWAGAWELADTLEVDFTYIPITENHLKPVATQYTNFQESIDYENYVWTGEARFRTSLVSFPLYFIKNDEPSPETGLLPVVEFLVRQFAFFYEQRVYVYQWSE
jgi:hypothetical protein